ncbi:hypothetical protein AKJ09_00651 [Labilithrix luteola]|uniref:Protein translocase subunit SecE n=1 Tax=Labilithrix luteola TaxID=1391654 RepID=A0A0K1PKE2_9BACT|nr:preprotein translocase subunit SecE [Labilithrix luteola]AKU93987.1 hypothetical protein AKJ09_00651 [Labilithrix luteola]
MSTEEDLKKAEEPTADEDADEAASSSGSEAPSALARSSGQDDAEAEAEAAAAHDHDEEGAMALQLGYQRFVYAAYMAGAMLVAFLVAKIGHVSWYRLGQWKPEFGEPKDEIVYTVAAVVGVLVALYYWRKPSARQYANEVAEELSKVTWPSRKEVWNSTTVVILTTLFATVFFALMDQFWKYVTDKIYSF